MGTALEIGRRFPLTVNNSNGQMRVFVYQRFRKFLAPRLYVRTGMAKWTRRKVALVPEIIAQWFGR
jgi:hypothetical protein